MVAAKNSLRSAKTSRTSSNRVRLGLKLPSSSLRVTPGADERRPQPLLARSVNLWHFGFRSVAVLGLGSPGKRLWKPKKGIALESEAPIHRQGESKVRQAASSQRVGEWAAARDTTSIPRYWKESAITESTRRGAKSSHISSHGNQRETTLRPIVPPTAVIKKKKIIPRQGAA